MAVEAQALFDFCTRRQSADRRDAHPLPTGVERIEVAGMVKRAALGYDHTPLLLLEADSVGTCHVECRCLSEEVLLRARVGSKVTLAGFCQGLEDGVTAVMDRCELVAVDGRRTGQGGAPTPAGPAVSAPTVPTCTFCGRPRTEVRRLLTIGEKSICDRCVRDYSRRLGEVRKTEGFDSLQAKMGLSCCYGSRTGHWGRQLLGWFGHRRGIILSTKPK